MATTVKVLEVTSVDLTIFKSEPPILAIYAKGTVPTTGYKNGQLFPWIYIQAPPDGIWDFDFVADQPDGPQADVICPIDAQYYWHSFPKDMKGVRIHASLNKMEALLGEAGAKEASIRKHK